MRLTFVGAAHEVTGSCYLLETDKVKFLVDCGMEQGLDLFENTELPVSPAELDFVLLTHAHIDHSGMLPKLFAQGFKGPIFCTEATGDLCNIMLRDSAHIQEFEAEWRNRKGKRAGREEFVPEYTMADAEAAIEHLNRQPYNKEVEVGEGIRARFIDAGHLLGSSSIEIWMREGDIEKKLVFSGDIGNLDQPLINDPTYIESADYVIMESTYGDRSHDAKPDYVASLADVLQKTFDRGGNVVIPSFAVGRTQEMLYFIRQIKADNLVPKYKDFLVYVDSPLAIEATSVFDAHYTDCFDEEARALVAQGINPIRFPGLKTAITADESKMINFDETPKVIISASGMCDAGRIKHHLKHNLWRPECTILFVGFQSNGTLGRSLVDGADKVKVFGEEIQVKAEIRQLPGISGHADNEGLMRWASAFKEKPTRVFVTHGEDTVTEVFADRLRDELGYDAYPPYSGTVFDIANNEILDAPIPRRIEHSEESVHAPASRPETPAYTDLRKAGEKLLEAIRHNEGGANADLAKFMEEVEKLAEKWDR